MTKEQELELSRENLNGIIKWLYEELRNTNETLDWYKNKCNTQEEHIKYLNRRINYVQS